MTNCDTTSAEAMISLRATYPYSHTFDKNAGQENTVDKICPFPYLSLNAGASRSVETVGLLGRVRKRISASSDILDELGKHRLNEFAKTVMVDWRVLERVLKGGS